MLDLPLEFLVGGANKFWVELRFITWNLKHLKQYKGITFYCEIACVWFLALPITRVTLSKFLNLSASVFFVVRFQTDERQTFIFLSGRKQLWTGKMGEENHKMCPQANQFQKRVHKKGEDLEIESFILFMLTYPLESLCGLLELCTTSLKTAGLYVQCKIGNFYFFEQHIKLLTPTSLWSAKEGTLDHSISKYLLGIYHMLEENTSMTSGTWGYDSEAVSFPNFSPEFSVHLSIWVSYTLKKWKAIGKVNFNNIFYTNQSVQNIIISTWALYVIILSLQNWVCVSHFRHISIWSSHIFFFFLRFYFFSFFSPKSPGT